MKNSKKVAKTSAKTQKSPARKSKTAPATQGAVATTPEAATVNAAENGTATEKTVDTAETTAVESAVTSTTGSQTATVIDNPDQQKDNSIMEDQNQSQEQPNQNGNVVANLDAKERSTIMVVYTVPGRPGSVRFSKTLFPDSKPPATIEFPANLFAGPKVERAKETPEQRKARLAAKPKPTAAEKLARLESKLEKLRAKAASESGAQTQAAGEPAQAAV